MPLGRAGHTFTLKQLRPAPNTGFDNIPLSLEITGLDQDGNPTAGSFLALSTTESLVNDYFITDDTAGDSTSPNRLGTATFYRRSFEGAPWFLGDGTPSTNFFLSLPAARAGHQFSIGTATTSSPLTLSPELAYASVDEYGNLISTPYGFFEGWISIGPASDSPFYFVVDQTANEITVALAPSARDLINVAWEPIAQSSISGSGITRAIDIRVPGDNRYATFTVYSAYGFVQNVQPVDVGAGDLHVYVALGVNQDFWLQRVVDQAASPTYHLGFFDSTLDLGDGIFPPNPAEDDDNSDPAGTPVNLIIPANRWDHPLMVMDINDNFTGQYASVSHMNGYWSSQNGESWFTSYYQLDATATSPGPGWRLQDQWTGEFSARNPRDLTSWTATDADVDSDGDSLVDWYERLIGTNPWSVDSDSDGMTDGWEITWRFNPTDPGDAHQDADGDGVDNYTEYAYHMNPRSPDTDGDGMPDGWEFANMLNPLVNDADEDLDQDGLSNYTEFQAGTSPDAADTDSDGYPDFWELEHGGNPKVNGNWPRIAISAGRLGHHFTLWRQGVASEFHPQLETIDGRNWAVGYAEVYNGLGALTDDTTDEDFSLSGMTSNTYMESWDSWTPMASDGTRFEYFLVPPQMEHDVLIVCSFPEQQAGGAPSQISLVDVHPWAGVYYGDAGGCEARGKFYPQHTNWLVNLTTQQKATLNVTDFLHGDGFWQPNDIQLPVRGATIQLRPDDVGRAFTVTSLGFNGQYLTAVNTLGNEQGSTLHASVLEGLPFRVTRVDDNAWLDGPPVRGTVNYNFTNFPPDSVAAPLSPNVKLISFRAGVEHQGITGFNDTDSSPITVWPDGTGGAVDFWDASGQIHTYSYLNYSAYVDPATSYHFQDADGNTDFWSAAPWLPTQNPPSLPAQSYPPLLVALSLQRKSHNLTVTDPNGNVSPLQVQPGYEETEYYYTAHQFDYAGTLDEQDHGVYYGYFPAVVAGMPAAGPYRIDDVSTGDSLYFAYDATRTMLDLSAWLNTQQVDVNLSVTRLGHTLEIHTLDGRTYPLAQGSFLNPWQPGWQISPPTAAETWSFLATGTALSDGGSWWVYDRDTDEAAPPYAQDLKSWVSADTELDSDMDGLPDWFERIVGLNPQIADYDGDGLKDGFEVQYQLNPFQWQIDTDNDGMSDIWEIAHGLNPRNPDDATEDRNGDGISNAAEFGAVFPGGLPTSNLDSDGDGIPDDVEVQNGTDPNQSDAIDSDGDGVPDYRDAWPFEPLLQGKPQAVPRYAIIEIHQLAPNEHVDKLLLGESGQVAYQLSQADQISAEPTAFYWNGSSLPVAPQQMTDPSDPAPTETRGFFTGLISLTQEGTVFGGWNKTTEGEINDCTGVEFNRLRYPSACWTTSGMTYRGPVPIPTPFVPGFDHPEIHYSAVQDDILLDRYGSWWSNWNETGEMARRDLTQILICPFSHLPYFGIETLAGGSTREILYNGEHLKPNILGVGTSELLHAALDSYVPNFQPFNYDSPPLSFVTANDLGGCLAIASRDASTFAPVRLFLSELGFLGPRHENEITLQFPAPPSSIVALSNDGVILTRESLLAKDKTGQYKYISARASEVTSSGPITWADFNANHTAVGEQIESGKTVLLVNDTVCDLSELCGDNPPLRITFAPGGPVPQIINDQGMIVAVASRAPTTLDDIPPRSIVLLVPLYVRSPQAANNGRYDIYKHDSAIYPRPGHVSQVNE